MFDSIHLSLVSSFYIIVKKTKIYYTKNQLTYIYINILYKNVKKYIQQGGAQKENKQTKKYDVTNINNKNYNCIILQKQTMPRIYEYMIYINIIVCGPNK